MKNYRPYQLVLLHTGRVPISIEDWFHDSEQIIIDYLPYHLYITSDESISKGDWSLYENVRPRIVDISMNGDHKIIASTNSLLPLPKINQSFIDYYNNEYKKGNKIEKVYVEYEDRKDFIDVKDAIDGDTWKLVINQDNTINIKPIKENLSKKEIEALFIEWNEHTWEEDRSLSNEYLLNWLSDKL